jgi:hypothetical protein
MKLVDPGSAIWAIPSPEILQDWYEDVRKQWSEAERKNTLSGFHKHFSDFCDNQVDVYYFHQWVDLQNLNVKALVHTFLPSGILSENTKSCCHPCQQHCHFQK